MNERDQLTTFHQIISQQLNARLEESPRFFWALVTVSTGYGYVLWSFASTPNPTSRALTIATFASILSYFSTLWASWYLAALGYAFRFLQHTQHSIEKELGWDVHTPNPSDPRAGNIWWLLPSIYHPYVIGLCIFVATVGVSFCWLWWGCACMLTLGGAAIVVGILFINGINRGYRNKFIKRDFPKLRI